MNYVRRENGIVVETRGGPKEGLEEAPDTVQCEWEKVGEVWQKSAALIAKEAEAADRASKKTSLSNAITTLRAWSDDIETAVAAWDGWTTAQRFAALKTLSTRTGLMQDHLANLLEVMRVDKP